MGIAVPFYLDTKFEIPTEENFERKKETFKDDKQLTLIAEYMRAMALTLDVKV